MNSDPRQPYAALGSLLLEAGTSVTDTRKALEQVQQVQTSTRNYGFMVLPQTVLISDAEGEGPVYASRTVESELTTRQAASVNRLLRMLLRGERRLGSVTESASAIRKRPVPAEGTAWILGSALIALGLTILFHCPWWAIALSTVTGAVVGLMTMLMNRITTAAAIVPFVATFVSTLIVGTCAALWDLGPVPLYAVCAPTAILVPGALITKALLELTAADTVTGAARLVSGIVILLFMAAGIYAGAHLTDLTMDPGSAALVGDVVAGSDAHTPWLAIPSAWFAWVGVVALALGIGVAFKAGFPLTCATVGAMLLTYSLLLATTPMVGSIVATGLSAAVLFVGARLVEHTRWGIPSAVSFQPAFLLLVPGTVGLVALTTLDPNTLSLAPLTFLSLCIGAKVGSTVADARWSRIFKKRILYPNAAGAAASKERV